MDPLAHTLVGASLAQTRLKKLSPLAAPTLLIGANLPDIDAVFMFLGSDAALEHRRGWTHGVLALVLLPWLLAGAMLLYERWICRRRGLPSSAANGKDLLLLSYIGVLTHPFLDWLNTYGIRLLMPFSERWFYGDTLFIVDLWVWLLMGAAAMLAYSSTGAAKFLWSLLAGAATYLVWSTPDVPFGMKLIWGLAVLMLIVIRVKKITPPERAANFTLAALSGYLLLMFWGNSRAEAISVERMLLESESPVVEVMTGPLSAQFFHRQLLVVTEEQYHGFKVHWLSGDLERTFEPVARTEPSEVVQKALKHPDIKGFVKWMRYPFFEVRPQDGGDVVVIRDLRYALPDQEDPDGFGSVHVFVPHSL